MTYRRLLTVAVLLASPLLLAATDHARGASDDFRVGGRAVVVKDRLTLVTEPS